METQVKKKRGSYNKSAKQFAKEVANRVNKTKAKRAKKDVVEVVMYAKPNRNPKKSRATVAGVVDYKSGLISIHGARNNTSLKEVFNRPTGRQIALGRAKKHPLLVVPFEAGQAREKFYEVGKALIKKSHKIIDDNKVSFTSVKDIPVRNVKNTALQAGRKKSSLYFS